MTFVLNMSCDNAAFEEDPGIEVAAILQDIADKLMNDREYAIGYYQTIFDSNGNDVGRWRLK